MDHFSAALIPIAVAIVVGLLSASAAPQATVSEGRTTIAYGRGFKAFAVLSGLFASLFFACMLFFPKTDRIHFFLLFLLFGLTALYLLMEGFCVRVVYDGRGIRAFSPWRPDRFVEWNDVLRVSYSQMAQWHRIETRRQGFIRVHDMKSGIPVLLEELRRRGIDGAD